jgi:hypothetical protein
VVGREHLALEHAVVQATLLRTLDHLDSNLPRKVRSNMCESKQIGGRYQLFGVFMLAEMDGACGARAKQLS